MKILDTLTLVLIAVIFCSSVVADRLPAHLEFLGFANTTMEDIEKFEIELCEKNGGPNTYAAHQQSRVRFDTCMRTATELESKEERRLASQTTRQVDSIPGLYQSYCRRIPEMENCVIDLTDSMKTCLDSDKHESADIAYDIISKIGRFLCEDNAARILKIISSRAIDRCLQTKMGDVMICANQTLGNYVKSVVSHEAELGGVGGLHLLVPDFHKCDVFDKFHDCAIRELKSCPDPTARSYFDSVSNIVKDIAKCKRFLNSHASPANSAANGLLTTAVLAAISLRFV